MNRKGLLVTVFIVSIFVLSLFGGSLLVKYDPNFVVKALGSECTTSANCGSGYKCHSGFCVRDNVSCTRDSMCGAGEVCQSGQCNVRNGTYVTSCPTFHETPVDGICHVIPNCDNSPVPSNANVTCYVDTAIGISTIDHQTCNGPHWTRCAPGYTCVTATSVGVLNSPSNPGDCLPVEHTNTTATSGVCDRMWYCNAADHSIAQTGATTPYDIITKRQCGVPAPVPSCDDNLKNYLYTEDPITHVRTQLTSGVCYSTPDEAKADPYCVSHTNGCKAMFYCNLDGTIGQTGDDTPYDVDTTRQCYVNNPNTCNQNLEWYHRVDPSKPGTGAYTTSNICYSSAEAASQDKYCVKTPPTVPPVTTPPATGMCTSTKIYAVDQYIDNEITPAAFTGLRAGAQVYFCVSGVSTGGFFTEARFTINGVQRYPVTTVRPGTGDFCDLYTIPANTYSFKVQGELYHEVLGWL